MEFVLEYLTDKVTGSRPISILVLLSVVTFLAFVTWAWALGTAQESDIYIGIEGQQLPLSDI